MFYIKQKPGKSDAHVTFCRVYSISYTMLALFPIRLSADYLRHIAEQYLHDGQHWGFHCHYIQTLQNFQEKYE